jgi:hypothetical protein
MNKGYFMKKLILSSLILSGIFTGCTNTNQNVKPISMKSVNLLDKYGISENALLKINNGYIFVIPNPNGSAIYILDKNYNLTAKKTVPVLLDLVKYEIKNNNLYILGYDQKKNRVALLIYDTKGNLKKIDYFGKKYDLARDFTIINGKIYVAVTNFSPNSKSDIVIYTQDNRKITFSTPDMDDVTFIRPYGKGLLIIGVSQGKSEDVIAVYKTLDNKTVWAKKIDLGMDEKPLKVSIKNNLIDLKIISTDNMGAEKYVTFTIDENGNVKSVKKGIEFKQLPMKYRT